MTSRLGPVFALLALLAGAFGLRGLALWSATPLAEREILRAARSGRGLEAAVGDRPDAARRLVERLLASALSERASGGSGEDLLRQAERLSAAIQARLDDPTLAKATAHVRSLSVEAAQGQVGAHQVLRRARGTYQQESYAASAVAALEAREACRGLGDERGELEAYHLLAESRWAMGQAREARRAFRGVSRLAKRRRDAEHLAAATLRLGTLSQDGGEYGDAAHLYRTVLDLAEKHGLPRLRASAALYLGNLERELGESGEADRLYASAEADFKALGERALQAAVAVNRGASLRRQGLLPAALASYRQALLLYGQTSSPRERADALVNVAQLLVRSGDTERALQAISELTLLAPGSSAEWGRLHWAALITEGDVRLSRGEIEEASALYDEAAAVSTRAGRPLDEAETTWRKARLLDFTGEPDAALSALARAVSVVDDLRGRLTSEDERVRFLDSRHLLVEELAGRYLHSGKPSEAFAVLERFRSRAFLDLIEGVVRVDRRGPEGPRVLLAAASEPLSLDLVASALPEDTLLVHYTLASGWRSILALDRGGLRFWTVEDVEADEIQRLVSLILDEVGERGATGETFGLELGRALLEPVAELLSTHRTLLIVPDGALFAVPWGALRWGADRRRLADTHALALEPSASALVSLMNERGRRPGDGAALVVASPISEGVPLSEARGEAQSLGAMLPGSRVLMGETATEVRVRREIKRHDIIHFATHARVDAGRALSSALVLTSAPGALEATRRAPFSPRDGILTGYEVLDLSLTPGALVTLAACETAGRPSDRGDGVAGLARAFFHAGAGSVVASLWPVEDRATRELMVAFYRNLAAGRPRAAALAEAQAALARGEAGERLAHPYYWAGFILLGDPN